MFKLIAWYNCTTNEDYEKHVWRQKQEQQGEWKTTVFWTGNTAGEAPTVVFYLILKR
jgi:hypothetical protein